MSCRGCACVVAMAASSRGIGVGNALPWRIRGDMEHFVTVTKDCEEGARFNFGATTHTHTHTHTHTAPHTLALSPSHPPLLLACSYMYRETERGRHGSTHVGVDSRALSSIVRARECCADACMWLHCSRRCLGCWLTGRRI